MPFNFGNGTGSNSGGGGDTLSTQQKNFLSAWTTDTSAKSLVTEYTVTTGTNSIKLGDDHKISAGGGELTIQIGDDYYFAVLQTLSQNNHLNFIKITSAEAIKEVQSTNSGDIIAAGTGTSYTTTDSEVVTGITVIPATSGYLTYTIYSGNSNDGTVIYSKTQLVEDDDIGTETTLTDSFWLADNTAIFAEFSGCSLYGDSSLGVYTTINYFVGDLIYIPTEFTAPLFNDEGVLQLMLDNTYFDTDTDGNLTLDVSNIDATELKNASSLVSGSIQGTFAETAAVTDFADAVNGNFWIYQSTTGTSLTLGTYTFSDGDFLWCYADVDVTLTTLNFASYFSYVQDTSSTATDSIYGKVLLSTDTPAEATEDGDAGTVNGTVANADHSHPFATQPVVHGGTGLETIPALSILGTNTADTVEAITVPSSKTTDLVMTYDYDNDVVGWSEYVGNSTESSRTLDYGNYSLSSNVTLGDLEAKSPVDTVELQNGSLTLNSNGVGLIGGRTYKITVYGQIFYDSTSLYGEFAIYDYTNSTQISEPSISTTTETVLTTNRTSLPFASTIYTPESDCTVCIYNTRSSRDLVCYTGYVTMLVEEIPSTVTAYVPADEVTVTNNDTATANQVLSSNGDQTATWSDDLTLNGTLDVAGSGRTRGSHIVDSILQVGNSIEVGPQDGIGTSTNITYIDFHANANLYNDYDGRIIVYGGDATGDAATANMQFEAASFIFGGPVTLDSTSSIDGDILVVVSPPTSATSTGIAKQVAYDSDYIYLCVATDTWRRVALASW